MSASVRVGSFAAVVLLMNGCGQPRGSRMQPGTFSNIVYWQQFFGPGTAGQNVAGAYTPGAINPSPAHSLAREKGEESNMAESFSEMEDLFRQSNVYMDSFPAAERAYFNMTARLKASLDPDNEGPRKTIDEATHKRLSEIVQRTIARRDQQRGRVRAVQEAFGQKLASVLKRAGEIEKICSGSAPGNLSSGCPRFLEALSVIRVKAEVLSSAFAHAETVYEEQRKLEDELATRYHAAG